MGCILQGLVAQNRAIEGDEVALQILPPSQWFINHGMARAVVRSGTPGAAAAKPEAATAMEAKIIDPLASGLSDVSSASLADAAATVQSAFSGELPLTGSGKVKEAEGPLRSGVLAEASGQLPEAMSGELRGALGSEGRPSNGSKHKARRSVGRRQSSQSKLVEATRLQLEAAFSSAQPPWENAESPAGAIDIIASL